MKINKLKPALLSAFIFTACMGAFLYFYDIGGETATIIKTQVCDCGNHNTLISVYSEKYGELVPSRNSVIAKDGIRVGNEIVFKKGAKMANCMSPAAEALNIVMVVISSIGLLVMAIDFFDRLI